MSSTPPRAITAGSATVDIITVVADRNIERMTMSNATTSFLLLEEGRKVEAESITIHPGGGALNVAIGLSRLGYEVAPLIKLGNDLNALRVLDALAANGLGDRFVRRTDRLGTGTAVMVSSHDRNATIFTFRGANTLLEPSEIEATDFAGVALVHISGLSNRSADCFPLIVERAARAGAFVSANPGIRQLTSRREPFLATLQGIDLLVINRVEAEALLPALCAGEPCITDHVPRPDWPALARRGLAGSGFDMGLHDFAAALHQRGLTYVAVTDGTDGAYLSAPDGLTFMPPVPVTPAGSAGAGDAFAGTLAAWLCAGAGPAAALAAAAVNAASVVTFVDTSTGLLQRGALEARLEAGDLPAPRLLD